jgi:hypothetical protein
MGFEERAREAAQRRADAEMAKTAAQRREHLQELLQELVDWLYDWSERTGISVEDVRVMNPHLFGVSPGHVTVEFVSSRTLLAATRSIYEQYSGGPTDVRFYVHMLGEYNSIESFEDFGAALNRHPGQPPTRRQMGKLRKKNPTRYGRDNGVPISQYI